MSAGAAGAEMTGEEREKRVKFLETMLRLHKFGTVDDESYGRYSAELKELKGG